MMQAQTSLLAALLVLLCACASSGRQFSVDSVPMIQRGKWTQVDVQKRFGPPQGVVVRGSGPQLWRYRFEERSTGLDTGVLTRIAGFVARLFGQPFFGSPVNVRSATTTIYRLDVEFDQEGVVMDYTYASETRPEREVY